ncbi:MAG: hypothetical protein LBK94_09695 [Prevotellaceae bacterium]|nr:hypothetical protein [Prevotellaceae bacterium]
MRAFVNDNDTEVVATAEYVNGGFTLTLPANIDSRHLKEMMGVPPSGMTVSDMNAKLTVIDAYGFIGVKSGHRTGEFQYITAADIYDLTSVLFFYADRNVTWDGDYIDNNGNTEVWDNVSFKKGWNTVYYTVIHHNDNTNTSINSTTKPNVTLKWTYLIISSGI